MLNLAIKVAMGYSKKSNHGSWLTVDKFVKEPCKFYFFSFSSGTLESCSGGERKSSGGRTLNPGRTPSGKGLQQAAASHITANEIRSFMGSVTTTIIVVTMLCFCSCNNVIIYVIGKVVKACLLLLIFMSNGRELNASRLSYTNCK